MSAKINSITADEVEFWGKKPKVTTKMAFVEGKTTFHILGSGLTRTNLRSVIYFNAVAEASYYTQCITINEV